MQSTDKVMMIRPAAFGFNAETAASNKFQNMVGGLSPAIIQQKAAAEFDNVVEVLKANGITVFEEEDTDLPVKPDAVFPNNWVGFLHGHRAILYPMLAENRRIERRMDIIKDLEVIYNYRVNELTDFTHLEKEGMFLEGTGSVVFDHDNETAYCGLSQRSNLKAFELLCTAIRYKSVAFAIHDDNNYPVYHTNVVLAIGTNWIVVCLDAVSNKEERGELLQNLIWTGKEIIKISFAQMRKFCGNILELKNPEGDALIAMSATAKAGFSRSQIESLESHGKIVAIPVPTIEEFGGGSLRCMLAEVFD
jgi:hypothetical protein